jgi:hypothetical protein
MEPKLIPYHDLVRVLRPDAEAEPRSCPICQLAMESVVRYLDDLIFFSAVKPDTRAEIRAARGFCNEHASQLAQLTGKGLGVALIHEDIIDTVMEGLQAAAPRLPSAMLKWPASSTPTKTRTRQAANRAVQALAPQGPCLPAPAPGRRELSRHALALSRRRGARGRIARLARLVPALSAPGAPRRARYGRAAAADRDSNRMPGTPARRVARADP